MIPLKTQAIQTALTGNWQNAITLNQAILDEEPNDIDAMNRLAYAHASQGNTKEAKNIYQKVLTIDIQNPIALRNLKRLSENSTKNLNGFNTQVNNLFIEEPGKTKVVELVNVAEQKLISQLRSGEFLNLNVKRMKIFLLDRDKQYIGMLPDDIGRRLLRFIDGGNKYEAYVKTVSNHKVIVFIKESFRTAAFRNQPSFVSTDKTKLSFESEGKHKNKHTDSDDNHSEDNEESF